MWIKHAFKQCLLQSINHGVISDRGAGMARQGLAAAVRVTAVGKITAHDRLGCWLGAGGTQPLFQPGISLPPSSILVVLGPLPSSTWELPGARSHG